MCNNDFAEPPVSSTYLKQLGNNENSIDGNPFLSLHGNERKPSSHNQRAKLTPRDAVPCTPIGRSIDKAAVIVILATGSSIGVRHDGVERRVCASQALEDRIVRAGAVFVSGT